MSAGQNALPVWALRGTPYFGPEEMPIIGQILARGGRSCTVAAEITHQRALTTLRADIYRIGGGVVWDAPPRIRGGLGAKSGLGACSFLGRDQCLTVCLCHELHR